MHPSVRVAACVVVAVGAVSISAAGSAFADGVNPASVQASAVQASSVQASSVAAHGLGAHKPAGHIAARVGGVSALAVLPVNVDLRQWAVPAGNQGQVSSCVTWAIDYAMLGWYSRYSGRAGQPFAPMYTYSQINGGADVGTYPAAALDIAKTQGSDTRAHYTHGDYDWRTKPTAAEKANAANYKIKSYTTLFMGAGQAASATLIKQALSTKRPVAIEMAVRHGFDVLGAAPTAVDNDSTSAIRGYHEVLAVGYDAAGLIIQNSWGAGWANNGFGRLSWRVVLRDVWEGDTIEGFATPPTPPKLTAPVAAIQTAPGLPAATPITYKVTWTGTPGTSGPITKYDAYYQVDGGALITVKPAPGTSTTFNLVARSGHTYRIGVRATAGTVASRITYGTAFLAKIAAKR
jgi:hypothetical protein